MFLPVLVSFTSIADVVVDEGVLFVEARRRVFFTTSGTGCACSKHGITTVYTKIDISSGERLTRLGAEITDDKRIVVVVVST